VDKGKTPAAERIKRAFASNQSIVESEERTAPDTLDHQYMREQVQEYRPAVADRIYKTSDSVYETTQLSGFRMANGAGSSATEKSEKCEIHLYEMYWADLSRVGSDWLRVLIVFYQLLAYLCGVGRKSLDFARAAS